MARPTSFRLHIRPLFRQLDVSHMDRFIDLTDYNDVRAQSGNILNRLRGTGRLMPPKEDDGPWPEEWIALFERWIREGHPE